jgi:hypothetical protein|tara:strand:- start:4841 stop:5011 length:171 start_codon:yes stop_codon:yes gene_type:complete
MEIKKMNDLTPKEIFEQWVQRVIEKKKEIQRKAIEMEKRYEQWLWNELGIEGVSRW